MSEEITIKVKQAIADTNPVNQPVVDPMLTGFFRLNPNEISNSDKAKLDEINSYLSDVDDEMERVAILKDMRFKMGHPSIGTSELEHFHKYIRIRNSIKQQEAQLKALER